MILSDQCEWETWNLRVYITQLGFMKWNITIMRNWLSVHLQIRNWHQNLLKICSFVTSGVWSKHNMISNFTKMIHNKHTHTSHLLSSKTAINYGRKNLLSRLIWQIRSFKVITNIVVVSVWSDFNHQINYVFI